MRYLDDEPLPGSDRVREKYGTIPMLISDMDDKKKFPFRSWASSQGFAYPAEATSFLSLCDSAAEAFFARAFVTLAGVSYVERIPTLPDGTTLRLQVRRGQYRIDFVAEREGVLIAIEIDGMTFHARKWDQVAADYLRERRLVALGYVLVRFTAQEVFGNSSACWTQVAAILTAHTKRLTR